MKASYKRLKTILALEVKKVDLDFLALKLGEFLLFDGFFNIANLLFYNFFDLDNFFNFLNFLVYFILLLPNLLISLLSSFFSITNLLLLFLLVADLSNDSVVFNIEVRKVAILQKP